MWLVSFVLAADGAAVVPTLAPTPATSPAAPAPPPVDPDADERIVVYDDLFRRWDGTRWLVRTQVGLPAGATVYAQENEQTRIVAYDLTLVMRCEKEWPLGKRRYEVHCRFEDLALSVAPFDTDHDRNRRVLRENEALLKSAAIELQVTDKGQIDDVGLIFPESTSNRRINVIQETLRQLVLQAVAGFHMRIDLSSMHEGTQWLEYNSRLFNLPVFPPGPTDGNAGPAAQGQTPGRSGAFMSTAGASMGSSQLIHQFNRYRGLNIVQSTGRAAITIGDLEGLHNTWDVQFDGVSIYNLDNGVMTERVWSSVGTITAGSTWAEGGAGSGYFTFGQFRLLEEQDKPAIGDGHLVSPPRQPMEGLPTWLPIK